MMFDTSGMKVTIDQIGELVGEDFRKEDTGCLLMLVSRVQWQLGALVSDLAEEVTRA